MEGIPDTIRIDLPELPCRIGVARGEDRAPQPVRVEVVLEVDLRAVLASGELADSVDYAPVHRALVGEVCGRRWKLLESLAAALMAEALRPDRVRAATVAVTKVRPPLADGAGPVTIEFRRERA